MEPLREVDKAYLAGFIDGEGSIGVHKRAIKRYLRSPNIRLRVTNTNRDVIMYIVSKFEAYLTKPSYRGKGHAPSYGCSWTGSRCISILKEILPYLIVKKKQAELALQINISIRGRVLGIDEKRSRKAIGEQIRELNKKGLDRWNLLSGIN